MNRAYEKKVSCMISVCILTRNSSDTIKRALDSLALFDDVVVLDNGSYDNTMEIAEQYSNVRVFQNPFIGFGKLRNIAATYAKHDWIFALDSDEELPKDTVEALLAAKLEKGCVYKVKSHNFIDGKFIRHSGWYPDFKHRIYNRTTTSFDEKQVHEDVIRDGHQVKTFPHPIYHYSYRSISDFLTKMEQYSTLFAYDKDYKKSTFLTAVTHSLGAFFKTYIIKLGFLDGVCGLLIAKYNSDVAFYKYLKLRERKKLLQKSSAIPSKPV
ncbi:MAG: hypothetical protein S4CHLAM102_12990 [Chlamydiia bacterium]|nr:hypothetical protein [Chlamydiia bacterium]